MKQEWKTPLRFGAVLFGLYLAIHYWGNLSALAALAAGEFDLYYGEVRLTADWDLRDLTGTGGALNYGGYTASYTDLLLENFLTADNRPAAARQLLAHLQDACPIAPICFKNDAVLTHPGVAGNLTPTASSTFYRMDRWTVRLSE